MSDYYEIKKEWEDYKKELSDVEKYICKFLDKPSSRLFCINARKKSKKLEIKSKAIRQKIIKHKQDYQSDYS